MSNKETEPAVRTATEIFIFFVIFLLIILRFVLRSL